MSVHPVADSPVLIMDTLRTSTAAHHEAAENHPFQVALNKGQAPLECYVAYLRELLHLHRAVEHHLREQSARIPAFAAVVRNYQYQVPYLIADLEHFNHDPDACEPTAATKLAIDRVNLAATDTPIAVLGMHYVLEGSKNGAKYISRNLARAYELQPGPGLCYFDPYGDQQREYWAQFKADMNAQSFTESETTQLVEGAVKMFGFIEQISMALSDQLPAANT